MLIGFVLGIIAMLGVIGFCEFVETMSRNHEWRLSGQQLTAAGQRPLPVTRRSHGDRE